MKHCFQTLDKKQYKITIPVGVEGVGVVNNPGESYNCLGFLCGGIFWTTM